MMAQLRVPGRKYFEAIPLEERFFVKVQKTDDHWYWLGSKGRRGYGQIYVDGHLCKAHRVSWELVNGPMPENLFACHTCDIPSCVNPDHIFPGTRSDNMADAGRKGRIPGFPRPPLTVCRRGHQLTPDNLVRSSGGMRPRCMACVRINSKIYSLRRSARQALEIVKGARR